MNRALDVAPLTTPLSRDEVLAWKRQAVASGVGWASFNPAQLVVLLAFVPFVGVFLVGGVIFSSLLDSVSGSSVIPAALILLLLAVGAGVAIAIVGNRRKWERWARLDRFARANAMTFSPTDAEPAYPGAIFTTGDSRRAIDHLRNSDGRFFDLGNYVYSTGSGKSRTTHNWGFLAFHLDRRLPNMVLDASANNGLFGGTNLPASFDKSQILHLEGDFDKYFTLYCPSEYERDALYVFTPDLMALLIDEAAPFDVEIVDDWMFVYSATPFVMTEPGVYTRLFRIMDTIGAKTLTQTDRYVDERIGSFSANIVAPAGTRLKRRFPVAGVVVVVIFMAFWLWGAGRDAVGGLFGLFG